MTKQNCRLCFKTKSKLIGIFTTRGIELDVADTIRTHFPDEVTEDGMLPRFVCPECWTKLAKFHQFYTAVAEAKVCYLEKSMKQEAHDFVQVNCDTVRSPQNEAFTELELPLIDDFDQSQLANVMSIPQWNGECDSDDIFGQTDSRSHRLEKKHDSKIDSVAIIAAADLANEIDTKDIIVPPRKRFDHLISDYMLMHCEICQEPLATLSKACSHYRRKHQRFTALMKCCQRRIKLTDIRNHIQYHLNPGAFTCTKCSRTYTSKRELTNHQHSHMPKQFECDICQKKFNRLSYIRIHMRSTHVNDGQRHECEVCKKLFPSVQKLNTHVKCVHERYYQSVCHVCAKVFNSLWSLTQHLQEHSDTKRPRSICQLCGKSFKDSRILQKHVERSHQSKELQCPHCPKISPNRNALSRHISSIHTYTAHSCHLCGKEFKRAVALTEHIAMHTGESLYNCAYCPKHFRSSSNMYKHYRQAHQSQWDADKLARR